jgi:hypothetical protein
VVQLNRLIERLCDANIDFVVVGGFAGMLHGSTLVTRDLKDMIAVKELRAIMESKSSN